ncbi:MAG: hypothetical protein ACJAZO_003610 [Myxococcota bacterium]|jgi:hypothetical protein
MTHQPGSVSGTSVGMGLGVNTEVVVGKGSVGSAMLGGPSGTAVWDGTAGSVVLVGTVELGRTVE